VVAGRRLQTPAKKEGISYGSKEESKEKEEITRRF
jgi:hypothetical protein